jgi:hypothetical protein
LRIFLRQPLFLSGPGAESRISWNFLNLNGDLTEKPENPPHSIAVEIMLPHFTVPKRSVDHLFRLRRLVADYARNRQTYYQNPHHRG